MKKSVLSPLLFGSALFSMSVLANIAPSWEIDEISKSTGYTTQGENQAKHQFGLVKHSNTCSSDELYVSWSSDSAEVWSLAGQTITVDASFDGISMALPLEVVAIRPLTGNQHEIVMGHVFANAELLDLMSHSDSVNVFMPETNELSRHFNEGNDRFSLHGFTEARSQALSRCHSMSS
ncbi:Uncharacterised protein [Zhongshania aliphaticivorans]|uniref:Uncharacterized protein n=1 Tax=Zhongshania aliphaticivorans TaxID=1470434 RepID=A0A5S9P789_9GAMM|nr:hypothetical protein [Zhongshania aliphaticivorans]CAA0091974.1 Uncharacterised protein [Zhongshania aliphaticivorans]CAA0099304.1 Uncharacterised protein [Zhongshania aliphaticivorans]